MFHRKVEITTIIVVVLLAGLFMFNYYKENYGTPDPNSIENKKSVFDLFIEPQLLFYISRSIDGNEFSRDEIDSCNENNPELYNRLKSILDRFDFKIEDIRYINKNNNLKKVECLANVNSKAICDCNIPISFTMQRDEDGKIWYNCKPILNISLFSGLYIVDITNGDCFKNEIISSGQQKIIDNDLNSLNDSGTNNSTTTTITNDTVVVKGSVKESLQTINNTYLLLKQVSGEQWVAVPPMQVNTGDNFSYRGGIQMTHFESHDTNRTFNNILFLDSTNISESFIDTINIDKHKIDEKFSEWEKIMMAKSIFDYVSEKDCNDENKMMKLYYYEGKYPMHVSNKKIIAFDYNKDGIKDYIVSYELDNCVKGNGWSQDFVFLTSNKYGNLELNLSLSSSIKSKFLKYTLDTYRTEDDYACVKNGFIKTKGLHPKIVRGNVVYGIFFLERDGASCCPEIEGSFDYNISTQKFTTYSVRKASY